MEPVRSHYANAMLGGQEWIVPLKRGVQRTAILQVGAVWVESVFAQMVGLVKLVQSASAPTAAGAMAHAMMANVHAVLVGQVINARLKIQRL